MKTRLFLFAAMLFSAVAAMAQMPDMPVDKDVRIGKLAGSLPRAHGFQWL